MIKSYLFYGSETCRLKEQVKSKMKITEIEAVTRAIKKTKLDRHRNGFKRNSNRNYKKNN